MAILKVDRVSKSFGGLRALQEISFEVEQGETLGIIGPNGAGKTTLFNLISGTVPADRGSIRLDGTELTGLSPHQICHLGVARTFQLMQPFEDLTALENVMTGALFARRSPIGLAEAEQRALSTCRRLGLEGKMHQYPGSLTVADRKRLELARAIASQPRVLLLDEVMSGLTPAETDAMIGIVHEIGRAGTTILMIEHVMRTIRHLCDRVVVIHHGRKLAEGPYELLARDPIVIDAYFGEAPED